MQDHLQQSKTMFLMHQIKNFKLQPQISNNIFEKHNPQYGPKYDNNNKIIARSVVGKPDIIERIKKKIEESKLSNSPKMKNSVVFQKMKQSYSNLSNMKKSQSSNKIPLFQDSIHSNILSRQVSHNKSSLTALINQHANVNIEQYLQETKSRIQKNEMEELRLEKQLTLFERNANTRQQRVITSFQEREQTWESVNMTIQSKCQTRSREKLTLLQKSQAYRLKKEILNELPSPPKNWYQQLRGSSYVVEKEDDSNLRSQRVNLNSKTLLIKQADLESSLRVRGENKLRRELENHKCPMITMVGHEKTEESEILSKLKY
ncbi:unnamed protein product [Paramecium octaurelia]|uniref:Uncharacterized protein n=1 Tax=Paramecium octaurelia TaxID=43137 RepID=A0A8S1W924_PAROT|nr:unnamed protein product [Paramecium octaurelia]